MRIFGLNSNESLTIMIDILENYKLISKDHNRTKKGQTFFKSMLTREELREYLSHVNSLKKLFED